MPPQTAAWAACLAVSPLQGSHTNKSEEQKAQSILGLCSGEAKRRTGGGRQELGEAGHFTYSCARRQAMTRDRSMAASAFGGCGGSRRRGWEAGRGSWTAATSILVPGAVERLATGLSSCSRLVTRQISLCSY